MLRKFSLISLRVFLGILWIFSPQIASADRIELKRILYDKPSLYENHAPKDIEITGGSVALIDHATGTGRDGDLTISGNQDFAALKRAGRRVPDTVAYEVTAINKNVITANVLKILGFQEGDEVLLIHIQGSSTRVGTWELGRVASVSGNRLTLVNNVRRVYGALDNSSLTGQKIRIQRVPNYNNVTITSSGRLYVSHWRGRAFGGLIAMRIRNKLTISGQIDASGAGFRGSPRVYRNNLLGEQGEGACGGYRVLRNTALCNGGGGGQGYQDAGGGGGGGNRQAGQNGSNWGSHRGGQGGRPMGTADLSRMTFGGAGGMGGRDEDGGYAGSGGNGGGIIMLLGRTLVLNSSGRIISNGFHGSNGGGGRGCGMGGGGGGAGGSIYIGMYDITGSGSILANGGHYGYSNRCGGNGGNGSPGRIFFKYQRANSYAYNSSAARSYLAQRSSPDPDASAYLSEDFSTNNPWIITKNSFSCQDFVHFHSFQEYLDSTSRGNVAYQFVNSSGQAFYWNGNKWTTTTATNGRQGINTANQLTWSVMQRLNINNLRLRSYLRSNGRQSVKLNANFIRIYCNATPRFVSTPPKTATENQRYIYWIKVKDKDDSRFRFTLKQGPSGVILKATGILAWTPGDNDAEKNVLFELEVDDRHGKSVRQVWRVHVNNVNDPPQFTSTPSKNATEDKHYIYQPTIKDPDPHDSWTYTLSSNVKNVQFNSQTGKIQWTPNDDDVVAQKRTFTLKVCDKAGSCATQQWEVSIKNINDPPKILSKPPTVATEDKTYTYNLKATDIDPNDKWTASLTTNAPKATIDPSTGQVTWTPGDADVMAKTRNFEVLVCDKARSCTKQKWTVQVLNVNDPPIITSKAPMKAIEDTPYIYKVAVQDPDPNETFTFSLKTKASHAKIDAKTGKLTWTPDDADVSANYRTFTIQVCDKSKACDAQQWTLRILNINDKPIITSTPHQGAVDQKIYTYQPTIKDPDPEEKHTWKLIRGPKGMTIDPKTGEVTWTPNNQDVNKKHKVTIRVCDKAGSCTEQSWTISVSNVNDSPIITSQAPTQATEDKIYTYQPTFKDPDVGDTHQWTLKKSPKTVQFSSKTGRIEWTPNDDEVEKRFDFELEICDQAKSCDSQKWTVYVKNINDAPVISGQPPVEAYVGKLISYEPKVIDPDPNEIHRWKLLQSPTNSSIDPKTGKVTWKPASSDVHQKVSFEIQVCDKAKACDSQKFQVAVKRLCTIDLDCPQQEICVMDDKVRVCHPAGCAKTNQCPQKDNFCQDDQCIANPCTKKQCNGDEVCRPSDGKCVKACAGVSCPQGEFCRDGQCQKDPCATHPCQKDEICDTSDPKNPKCTKNPCAKNGSCKHGRICLDGICTNDPCDLMTCPKTEQRCLAGQCVQRQKCSIDLDCPEDQICKLGRCYPAGCYDKNNACKQGQICLDGTCKDNVCLSGNSAIQCDKTAGEFCRPSDEKCAKSCATLTCPQGFFCQDGFCRKDPCDSITCAAGKKCFNGDCYPDLCSKKNPCKHGRICNPNLNLCQTDPCQGVQCPDPKQICKFGQCSLPDACTIDADCPNDTICSNGKCQKTLCSKNKDCTMGKLCIDGQCKDDPCSGIQCSQNTFCKLGKCVASCASVVCQKDEICIEGQCKKDPCHGVQCQQDETCSNGKCVPNQCTPNSCKGNRVCLGGRCVQDPCTGIQCPKGQTCQQGQCTGTQLCEKDDDCPSAGLCIDGKCTTAGCYKEGCPKGKLCLKGQCVENPCSSKKCNDDETCRPVDGQCVKLCPNCPSGQICVDGQCTADPCDGVTCQSDESCQNGQCHKDFCRQQSSTCRYQRTCRHSQCLDDPCTAMKCPDNYTCQNGQCYGTPKAEPTPEMTEELTENDAGEKEKETIPELASKEVGQAFESEKGDNPTSSVSSGGCSCQTSSPSSSLPFAFLLLLLLALFKPRRSRR